MRIPLLKEMTGINVNNVLVQEKSNGIDLIDFQTHQNYIENNIEKQRLEYQLHLLDQ